MGAIIGRGGSRITEIRHRSTQEIKIHEQEENSQNRRITVSGSKELIGMFFYYKLRISYEKANENYDQINTHPKTI